MIPPAAILNGWQDVKIQKLTGSVSLCLCLSASLSFSLSLFLSVSLSLCLSACLPVCLSVCLSPSLPLFLHLFPQSLSLEMTGISKESRFQANRMTDMQDRDSTVLAVQRSNRCLLIKWLFSAVVWFAPTEKIAIPHIALVLAATVCCFLCPGLLLSGFVCSSWSAQCHSLNTVARRSSQGCSRIKEDD